MRHQRLAGAVEAVIASARCNSSPISRAHLLLEEGEIESALLRLGPTPKKAGLASNPEAVVESMKLGRYELSDREWEAIQPHLPNKPRGVPRVYDRRAL